MAIYRPPKARWPLATVVGLAGIVCGLLTGLAIGSKEPDPLEAAQQVRAALVSATGSLEVAVIEYQEAIGDGAGGEVLSEAEYEGARDALASSRAGYAEIRPALEALAPSRADDLDRLYDRCSGLMADRAPSAELEDCAAELTAALEGDA